MVINHLEKLFVTSDAGCIIRESDVHHPAAKMIAQAAKTQENEAGDGTNFVITMAGELLGAADGLIKMGLHPSEILIGYEKAGTHALDIMEKLTCHTVENFSDVKGLTAAIKPAIASKRFGQEDMLSNLIARAAVYCMPKNPTRFTVDNIRVQKILGGNLYDSEVVHGMVVTRKSETTINHAKACKIAVFNTNIEM